MRDCDYLHNCGDDLEIGAVISTTYGHASIGDLIPSTIVGNISKIHVIMEWCFAIIKEAMICMLSLFHAEDVPRKARVGRES